MSGRPGDVSPEPPRSNRTSSAGPSSTTTSWWARAGGTRASRPFRRRGRLSGRGRLAGPPAALAGGGGHPAVLGRVVRCDDDDDSGAGHRPRRHGPAAARGLGRGRPRPARWSSTPGADGRPRPGRLASPSTCATLARDAGPRDARLQPFAVPTLFQSLAEPANQHCLRQADPSRLHHPSRSRPTIGARPCADLPTNSPTRPATWPWCCDLPGPASVALAAGAGPPASAPVFTFDNWPHPLGGGPLAPHPGRLRCTTCRCSATRPDPARRLPPLFVLDANRLTPPRPARPASTTATWRRSPRPQPARPLGIKRLLYMRPRRKLHRARRPERRLRRLEDGGHPGARGAPDRLPVPADGAPAHGGRRPARGYY